MEVCLRENVNENTRSFPREWHDWVIQCLEEKCEISIISRALLIRGFSAAEARDLIEQTAREQYLDLDLPDEFGSGMSIQHVSASDLYQHLPNLKVLQHSQGTIYVLDNFLDDSECLQLNQRMLSDNAPSTVITPGADQVSTHRTSSSHQFRSGSTEPFNTIDQRIADALSLDADFSETMQGQIYKVGQKFDLHGDYFEFDSPLKNETDRITSQRSWTALIYLNTVDDGGETVFPELNLKIKPRCGTLIFWNNLHEDGKPNPAMQHLSRPLERGVKTIISKWFRLDCFGNPHKSGNLRVTKALTRSGFLPMQMPDEVYQKLRMAIPEDENGLIAKLDDDPMITGESDTRYLDLSDETKTYCLDKLHLTLQSWVGCEIEPTCLYGIRQYRNGAYLGMHVDRPETHVVSAILCIESPDEDHWPLVIEDQYFRKHELNLKAGEMLLYESARLLHGRPSVYTGNNLKMAFAHFSLKKY